MRELDLRIIELILAKRTVGEILEALQISFEELQFHLRELKERGFNFNPEYYYNGSIIYSIDNRIVPYSDNNGNIIVNKNNANYFEAVIISDVHLGSQFERIDILNKVYDYCVREGIHIILNGGDFIHGVIGNDFRDLQIKQALQIEQAIKDFPHDDSIINFLVMGNHDYYALSKCKQNLASVLKIRRPDIVSVGFGEGHIRVENSGITLLHPIFSSKGKQAVFKDSIIIKGHTHILDYNNQSGLLYIQPSALVDFDGNDKFYLLKLKVNCNHGYFRDGVLTQVLINDGTIINEMPFTLKRKKCK